MTLEQAKNIIKERLSYCIKVHDAGKYDEVENGFEAFDSSLPRNKGPEFDDLFIALNFWDGWIDAKNHEWKYYDPIKTEDWPKLAQEIIDSFEKGKTIENPIVISKFNSRK